MKRCPYCAEEIQDEAIVCRFCRHDLPLIAPNVEILLRKDVPPPRTTDGPPVTVGHVLKRTGLILGTAIAAGIALIVVVGVLVMSSPKIAALLDEANRPSTGAPTGVSLVTFNRLETGMSYQDAVRILGKAGTEQARNSLAGTTTVMYAWTNRDGSGLNAMFQDDKLVSKAQFGLK